MAGLGPRTAGLPLAPDGASGFQGRHARRAMEEAAVHLARHEPRAGCFAAVRLEDSEARPAKPIEA